MQSLFYFMNYKLFLNEDKKPFEYFSGYNDEGEK